MTPSVHYHSWSKKAFDLLLASALTVVALPLLGLLFLSVLLLMGRPVIFTQQRRGQYKKNFTIFKFRTMYQGADVDKKKISQLNEAPFPMFKASYDPRFIGIGRFLSKTGLDELPQLFNILRGNMSFVGPRPLPIEEAAELDASWDFRYQVLPGIFSKWSLSAHRHSSLDHWKELEKETLKSSSLFKDIVLIGRNLLHHTHYLLSGISHKFHSKSV